MPFIAAQRYRDIPPDLNFSPAVGLVAAVTSVGLAAAVIHVHPVDGRVSFCRYVHSVLDLLLVIVSYSHAVAQQLYCQLKLSVIILIVCVRNHCVIPMLKRSRAASDTASSAVVKTDAVAPHDPVGVATSPAEPAVVTNGNLAICPVSPASNRERFRASQMPSQVTCDLSTVSAEPGHRFTFQGIVLVVFPASTNPLRRHVMVGDGRGAVGITVWNAHVNSFSSDTVGQFLVVTKVSVVSHNGTRGITLNKDSNVSFNTLADHFAVTWWQSILHQPAVSAILFCDTKDNVVVNVAGIVGSVSVEQKVVRSDTRDLVTIRIVDRTGIITLRTWNHSGDSFLPFVDAPVLFRRVRVTSFANQKSGELFDGSGTIVVHQFDGAEDLKAFWAE